VTSARRDHKEMLEAAGFGAVEEVDATPQFLRTTRGWYEARRRRADELVEAEGEALYEERQQDYRKQLRAIEAGLLCRSLFLAERLP